MPEQERIDRDKMLSKGILRKDNAMIYDVHVHFRSVGMMERALAQAERLDMVLCTNSINLEGSASPNFPSREFVTACNERTLGLAQQEPQRVIPFWYLNPVHGQFALRRVGTAGEGLPRAARSQALGSNPGQQPNCGRHHADPAPSIGCPCCSTRSRRLRATCPPRPAARTCGRWRCATRTLPSSFGHAAGDIEVGAKCALGLPNVLMDVGGNEANNGYTEILVKHVGADHVVYGSDASGRSFTSQLSKVWGADLNLEEKEQILYTNVQRIFDRQQELDNASI